MQIPMNTRKTRVSAVRTASSDSSRGGSRMMWRWRGSADNGPASRNIRATNSGSRASQTPRSCAVSCQSAQACDSAVVCAGAYHRRSPKYRWPGTATWAEAVEHWGGRGTHMRGLEFHPGAALPFPPARRAWNFRCKNGCFADDAEATASIRGYGGPASPAAGVGRQNCERIDMTSAGHDDLTQIRSVRPRKLETPTRRNAEMCA